MLGHRNARSRPRPVASFIGAYRVTCAGMDQTRLLVEALRQFARDRDWDQFHTPKNLAMALAGEVGELAGAVGPLFATSSQWDCVGPEVADEVGDVALYLLRLDDVIGGEPTVRLTPAEADRQRMAAPMELAHAMCGLMGSVGRVLENYQWLRVGSPDDLHRANARAGDLLTAMTADFLCVCALLGIDPVTAGNGKLVKNTRNYPIEVSRGSSLKHTEFRGGAQ